MDATISNKIVEPRQDKVRTLIIGAGISGVTLAALLHQRGENPVIVEREKSFEGGGYNLGLYPLGSRVLHGPGLYEKFLEASAPFRFYDLGNGKGEIMHHFDFETIAEKYGELRGIKRAELLSVIGEGIKDSIRFNTTVTKITQSSEEVNVTFSDGSSGTFDLVVGADGMHSQTRKMILSQEDWAYHETGWGCWVVWAEKGLVPEDTSVEYWGAGRGVGIYPVKNGLGVILAGPTKEMKLEGNHAYSEHIREAFGKFEGPIPAVLKLVEESANPYFWDLHDCRCKKWSVGRVVLLGDAADGFLPTAGIGASMAMLSAAALADELSRADAKHVDYALRLFVNRQQSKVEAAQENSRKLAKMMFMESTPLVWGRDQMMRFYTLDRALADIIKVMEGSV